MFGDPQAEASFSASARVTRGVDGAGIGSSPCTEDISCGFCGSMMNVSRRDAGVLNVRNSVVGEVVFAGVALFAGTRLPFRLARARGSIDLRRRLPPRGTREVSMA